MKDVMEYTLEELQALPISDAETVVGKKYNELIIVPLENIHDSGYPCMKYVLVNTNKSRDFVGVVGGYSDVLHLGRGSLKNISADACAHIDCLPNSHCIRLMFFTNMVVPQFYWGSDYHIEEDR